MSTEAVEVEEVKEKKSEPLFSKKNRKLISNPLDIDNPVTVQILGVCSALAVTTQMKPAFVMSLGLTIVTACSNVAISMLRNTIPSRIRIIVQLAIVSLWVILVDQILKLLKMSPAGFGYPRKGDYRYLTLKLNRLFPTLKRMASSGMTEDM